MEGAVGLGDSRYIEEQKDRGQYGGGVPYLWGVQTVDDPEKKPSLIRLCAKAAATRQESKSRKKAASTEKSAAPDAGWRKASRA